MTEQEPTNSGDVMVCTDCYFAHHYGCTPIAIDPRGAAAAVSGFVSLTGPIGWDELAGYLRAGWTVKYRVGESLVDLMPLGEFCDQPYDLWDATCSDHDGADDHTWLPLLEIKLEDVPHPCTHCKRADYDNGLYEFSWSSCQGCGSGLGGARYRLHWTERTSS